MDIGSDVQSAMENLKALPKKSPERPAALFRLGTLLLLRGAERQSLKDLDEAINYSREALKSHPKDQVDARRESLQNIACTFMTRYDLGKRSRDLDACIDNFREARQLLRSPLEGASSYSLLTAYGIALRKRHELRGQLSDIDEAVKLHRDTLALQSPDPDGKHWTLYCLALALSARGLQQKKRNDIDLAVKHHKEAFNLWPTEDNDRYSPLYNVACAFMACFDMSKNPTDLDESIQNYEEAIACITKEHPVYLTLCQQRDEALQKRRALGRWRPRTSLTSEISATSSQALLGAQSTSNYSQSSQMFANTSIFAMGSKCTMPLDNLINLVSSSPASADSSLKSFHWYKERDGVKHEFLVVQATPVEGGDPVWIRLDRAAKQDYAKTLRFWFQSDSSSSRFPADDCALICTEQWHAIGDAQCDETFCCRFQQPLRLEIFTRLLTILSEESPHYTLAKENCWFFCSTITEVLTSEFYTEGPRGTVAHRNLGGDVRERIRERFKGEMMMSRKN